MTVLSVPLRILIIDLNTNASLATIQTLGAAGYVCYGLGFNEVFNKSEYSKYINKVEKLSNRAPVSIIRKEVKRIISYYQIDIIIPTNDYSTLLCSDIIFRKDIEPCKIATPPFETLIKGMDKAEITKLSANEGLNTPLTYEISEITDKKTLEYPLYVKSRTSMAIINDFIVKSGVIKVNNEDELEKAIDTIQKNIPYPIVQSAVEGMAWGLDIISKEGELVNYLAHKRIRETNPSGGYSSAVESVKCNAYYVETVSKILKRLNWTGVAMFEFKGNPDDKESYLIEMNTRFWGSLPLAIFAEQNFPVQLIKVLNNEPVEKKEYKIGIKARWTYADVSHFIKVMKGPKKGETKEYPSKTKTFIEIVNFKNKYLNYNKVAKDDWMPEIMDITFGALIKLFR